MENMHTELHAVETLLQRGVKVKAHAPLLLRMFGKKYINFKLRQPTGGTLHRVSLYYLQTGISAEKLQDITVEEALTVMAIHGKNIYKAVACAIINSYWMGKFFTRPLAWWLRENMAPAAATTIIDIIIKHGGLADFMNTTRLIRSMKMTAPNLGQKAKGS